MFLTQQEIYELTGYQIPKCQMRILRENGIKFFVGGDGKPRVLKSMLESITGIKATETKTMPNYNALREWINNGA